MGTGKTLCPSYADTLEDSILFVIERNDLQKLLEDH